MNNTSQQLKYLSAFTPNHLATSLEVPEYILTAKLFRLILSLYLKDMTDCSDMLTLNEWLQINFSRNVDIQKILIDLIFNQDSNFMPIEKLKILLEYVQTIFVSKEETVNLDFIFDIFSEYQNIKTYGENILLHKVMSFKRFVEKNYEYSEHYEQFFRVFFKYVSIKNEFYQQVIQPTVINGLDFFKGYFERATDGILENQEYFTSMLRTLFQNRYLQKVELRISIKNSEEENRKRLLQILQSYQKILIDDYNVNEDPSIEFPLIGIIYHLIKIPDDINKDIELYDKERDHTIKQLHYGKLQDQYIKQVKIIQQFRKNIPMVTNFIVGLDAANLENNTPVQVFAPVFEQARDSQYDNLRIVDPEGNILPSQSIFFTFHAGEEFRHLNSGLRRMDEVIDYCKLHAGDRIGHGIALGVDIEKWARSNPLIVIPQGEYLDNLLWIWDVYSRTTKIQTETLVYLERQIYEIAICIFKDVVPSETLQISILTGTYKRRFKRIIDEVESVTCSSKVYLENFNQNKTRGISDELFKSYHLEETLNRMNEPIYVAIEENERMMATDMQNYLINKIANIGIVIEANPSSNEAIGEIDSLFGNQLFRIQSAGNHNLSNILVNINSDDPMIFNTNVSNELAYIYYGMLHQGIGREAALDWIEKLRKTGMDTSFIRGVRSRKEYLRILDMTIEALQDPYYC
jgi:adenosine deaminase